MPVLDSLSQSSPKSSPAPNRDAADILERSSIGSSTREWLITPRQCAPFGKRGIFLAGWSEAYTGFDFVRYHFPMSQLLFCVDGAGEVLIEGRWQSCGPGTAYLTPAQVLHGYRALPGKAWHVCWVTYQAPVVDLPEPMRIKADVQIISFLLRHLRTEAMGSADDSVMESWTQLLHTQVLRHVADAQAELPPRLRGDGSDTTNGRSPASVRLAQIWEQVALHPEQPWGVARLADMMGMSGEHLRRLCQNEIGCSPMQQVTRIRIAHAANLLTQGHTLAAVAAQVGYSNSFVLSNVFHRVTGVRPSRYTASA